MTFTRNLVCAIAGASLLAACGGEKSTGAGAIGSKAAAPQSIASPASRATAMSDDPITALCISYGGQVSTCECATTKFRASEPEANLYADIAARFLADDTPDKLKTDRWEDAQTAVFSENGRTAETLELNNKLGRGHRDALKACEG